MPAYETMLLPPERSAQNQATAKRLDPPDPMSAAFYQSVDLLKAGRYAEAPPWKSR